MDRKQLEKDKEKFKKGDGQGAPFWNPSEGEHLVFLCPPARGASLPYYAAAVHYTGESGIVCADPERNPVLKDPIFKKVLKGENKKVPDECSLCEKGEDSKPSVKFMMCVVPVQKKGTKGGEWQAYDAIEVRPYLAPRTVWNGVADILLDVGESVYSVDGPVLIKIKREGRTRTSTKYTVMPDTKTLKDTKPLGKKLKAHIAEAIAADGPSDPFKILARMFKTGEEMEAAGEGMKVDEDDGGSVFEDDDEKDEKAEERDDERESEKGEEEEEEEPPKKKAEKKSDKKKAEKKSDKKKGDKKPDKKKRPPCFGIDYDEEDEACQSCKIETECQTENEGGDGGSDKGESESGGGGDALDDLLGE